MTKRGTPREKGEGRSGRAPAVRPASRLGGVWGILAIAAVVAAGYFQTLDDPFHYDDFSSIRDNPALQPPTDVGTIWRFRPSRTVVHLSLAVDLALSGRSILVLHVVNLLIHLSASLLVGWIGAELWRRLRPVGAAPHRELPVGLTAALLFAAHPLATGAVSYLIQRTTSLAALLELAAVAGYLAARDGHRRWAWGASWACALLAAFTKEIAVALPIAIATIEIVLRRARGPGRAARTPGAAPGVALIPYFLVIPLVAWSAQLPSVELGRAVVGLRETGDIGRTTYLLTETVVVLRYLALWVWPRGQNLDHDVMLRTGIDAAVAASMLAMTAVSVATFLARRRFPLVLLGWAWFLITIAPESSVFPIRDVMMEHRMYLPMAGLAWGASVLLVPLMTGRRRAALVAVLVAALTMTTHVRNRVWGSGASLWSDVVHKSPRRARGYNNLGLALEADRRRDEAAEAYRRAIAVGPREAYARVNLGRLYGMERRWPEAIAVLEDARSLEPGWEEVWVNLGNAYWGAGDTARAVAAYGSALALVPPSRQAAVNLARLRGLPVP